MAAKGNGIPGWVYAFAAPVLAAGVALYGATVGNWWRPALACEVTAKSVAIIFDHVHEESSAIVAEHGIPAACESTIETWQRDPWKPTPIKLHLESDGTSTQSLSLNVL